MYRTFNLLITLIIFTCNNFKSTNNERIITTSINTKISNFTSKDFTGTWNYEFNSAENDLLNRTFELKLINQKENIKGQYCAVAKGGRKIDCNDKEIYNISGILKNDVAYVDFTGFFDKKAKGKAKIYFEGESIVWEIISVEGEIAAPKKALLKKSKLVLQENSIEGFYILKTCESSRFKIKIIKQEDIYSYTILDNKKSINKGIVKIENNKNKICLTFGKIVGFYNNDELKIQNYGDSMNEYVHFIQCEEKYLSFIKQ